MKNVPHWRLLVLIYIVMVGVPVIIVHLKLKKRMLEQRTFAGLALYFAAVLGTAFLANFICMWLYYKFLFSYQP